MDIQDVFLLVSVFYFSAGFLCFKIQKKNLADNLHIVVTGAYILFLFLNGNPLSSTFCWKTWVSMALGICGLAAANTGVRREEDTNDTK